MQDLVVGVRDEQSVAQPRPRQTNQFVIVGTYVTAYSARGDNTIQVQSTVGFAFGNTVLLMLDSGENQSLTITALDGNEMTFAQTLLASVGGNLGSPIENTVILNSAAVVTGGVFILDVPGSDVLDLNVLA